MEALLGAEDGGWAEGLRPLSTLLFLFGDGDDLRAEGLSRSRDLDLWKGGFPGEGGLGLPGEGGREVGLGGLEEEPGLLGNVLVCKEVGGAPTAAWAWRVTSVSPGGRLRVAVIINPGNRRDVVSLRSTLDSKLVTMWMMDSFVISVCNLTDSTIQLPKAVAH